MTNLILLMNLKVGEQMNVFLRIDINIVAMILLGIIALMAYKRLDIEDYMNKMFLRNSVIILIELFFETLTCIINKRPELWLIPITNFLHICLYITGPVLTFSWLAFINSWVYPQRNHSKKKNFIIFIPVILNAILTLLSPIYKFVFYISSSNVYFRGRLYIVSAFIIYIYICYGFIIILKQRKKMVKEEFLPLFAFGFLPILGGLIQSQFYGILLMWSSAAFSLVIVYNLLQQRMIQLDNLTGTWTRGSFDYYISQRLEQKNNSGFGVIFVDIDGLKQINDQYGHFEGDQAIRTSIKLIRNGLKKTDIVARFGGDEFVVISDCKSQEDLFNTTKNIKKYFLEYNEEAGKKYKLDCSFGADIFDTNNSNIDQFLDHVDKLMYQNKQKKKDYIFHNK
jgi:diguanylate cyclase (GGDEF)-like protein